MIKKPKCLEDEIKEYQEQMDVIARFISSECKVIPNGVCACRVAYKTYKSWCFDNNEFLMSEMKFSKELQKKGYKIVTNNQGIKSYEGFVVIDNDFSY